MGTGFLHEFGDSISKQAFLHTTSNIKNISHNVSQCRDGKP